MSGLPAAGRVLDLGSGGGLPGLVLARHRPELDLTLLEARQRACRFLRDAVAELGLARTEVVEGRAEEAARRPDLRETFEAVVARSFGPPAVTAECAVGFLRRGGHLIVTEPPESGGVQGGRAPPGERPTERWPAEGLDTLGFGSAVRQRTGGTGFVRLEKIRLDERWPRRVGIPAKRPLWGA